MAASPAHTHAPSGRQLPERRNVGHQRWCTAREGLDDSVPAALYVAPKHEKVGGAKQGLDSIMRQLTEEVNSPAEHRITITGLSRDSAGSAPFSRWALRK